MKTETPQLAAFLSPQACDPGVDGAGVQVWKAWLGADAEIDSLSALLSPDEADRAARFVFARDRRRFVAARAALRLVLGSCLEEAPEGLQFAYGPHGKPELASAGRHRRIQFNVAHSGDWALVAVTFGQRLGIDLEQVRPLAEHRSIANRHFSPREVAALESLPPALQEQAFFRCWTRKEAYLKALGCGLSHGLGGFDVSLVPDEPPALLASREDAAAPLRWRMAELLPAAGYIGAVAVETG